jgi:hypothetical protein
MKKLKVGVVGLVHDHVWGEMDKTTTCPSCTRPYPGTGG